MFDPQRLLGQLLGDALGGGFGGRRRRGGGLSFSTKAQLGLGALGVAMAAYEHFTKDSAQPAPVMSAPQPSPASMPPPAPTHGAMTPPPPPPGALDLARLPAAQADAVLLVQTMIAAAAADGVIDAAERSRLLSHAGDAGLDAQTRQFLEAELAVPKSADRIGAMTRPGLAEEVYTAAALAIDLDHDAEREFLRKLSEALGIDEVSRIAIHEKLEGR